MILDSIIFYFAQPLNQHQSNRRRREFMPRLAAFSATTIEFGKCPNSRPLNLTCVTIRILKCTFLPRGYSIFRMPFWTRFVVWPKKIPWRFGEVNFLLSNYQIVFFYVKEFAVNQHALSKFYSYIFTLHIYFKNTCYMLRW